MSKRIRKRFTSQEKVAILRLHFVEGTPVSDLCDKHGIGPSVFSRWQKDFEVETVICAGPRAVSRRAAPHHLRQRTAIRRQGFQGVHFHILYNYYYTMCIIL